MGYIYILHFEKPISPNHTTQHYIGFAESDPVQRAKLHAKGRSEVRLVEVAYERGIKFEVVKIFRGERRDERWLKNQAAGPCFCPYCCKTSKPRKTSRLEEVLNIKAMFEGSGINAYG